MQRDALIVVDVEQDRNFTWHLHSGLKNSKAKNNIYNIFQKLVLHYRAIFGPQINYFILCNNVILML